MLPTRKTNCVHRLQTLPPRDLYRNYHWTNSAGSHRMAPSTFEKRAAYCLSLDRSLRPDATESRSWGADRARHRLRPELTQGTSRGSQSTHLCRFRHFGRRHRVAENCKGCKDQTQTRFGFPASLEPKETRCRQHMQQHRATHSHLAEL